MGCAPRTEKENNNVDVLRDVTGCHFPLAAVPIRKICLLVGGLQKLKLLFICCLFWFLGHTEWRLGVTPGPYGMPEPMNPGLFWVRVWGVQVQGRTPYGCAFSAIPSLAATLGKVLPHLNCRETGCRPHKLPDTRPCGWGRV